jgi:hypothetical protein
MSDAPEIPEAKDRFEMTVALTIAVIAVVLSWISNFGDDAKTNAIIKTNEATNKWGHFQSKSIKEKLIATTLDVAATRAETAAGTGQESALEASLRNEVNRYKSEKADVQQEAEKLQAEADLNMKINDRCGKGALLLQVSIVIASVAILARAKSLWIASILLAVIGSAIGISSHFM